LTKEPYCLLPEAEKMKRELGSTKQVVKKMADGPLQELLSQEEKANPDGREGRIEGLFLKLAGVLTLAAHHPGRLRGVLDRLVRITGHLKSDWKKDMENIAEDAICRLHGRKHGGVPQTPGT
jgi:hypothetical protein